MVTIGMNVAMNGYDYENSSVHRMLEFAGGGGGGGKGKTIILLIA